MWTGEKIVIAVEDLATLHRIVKDEKLWAKEGEQSTRTIRI